MSLSNAFSAEAIVWRAIYAAPEIDTWWATDKPNEFVFEFTTPGEDGKGAVRVTITPEQMPAYPPSAWMDGEGPHPFGWEG